MSIAVKAGVGELDRERMRLCRKTCHTSSSQWRRYATREVRRVVSVVIAIVKKGGCNNSTGRKRLKRVSKSRRVGETKNPRRPLLEESCMSGTTPDVRSKLHTSANNTPIVLRNWIEEML